MYDNEMYGNSDNPRQATGNFSGANTADFDNGNRGYFNLMDHPAETPRPHVETMNETGTSGGPFNGNAYNGSPYSGVYTSDVHSDRADSIEGSESADRSGNIGMEAPEDRAASIDKTASVDRAASICMESTADRAAKLDQHESGDRADRN